MSQALPATDWMTRIKSKGPWVLSLWAVGIVSWSYLLIRTEFQLLAITAWSVPFLLMIAAVSTPWRSVSWSTLLALFMIGVGPIMILVVLTQRLIGLTPAEQWTRDVLESLTAAGFETSITFPSTVIYAPVIEELFKVLPLVLLVLWRRSRIRALAGPIDYAVMAGATGAGLSFSEDVLVYLNQGLPGPPSSIFALNLGPFYRTLVGSKPGTPFGQSDYADNLSFFFPDMQEILGVVWIGHGATALGLGLTLGLVVWGVRRLKNRLLYLVVPVVYLWVVWEHMMVNWYGGAACSSRPQPMCTLANLDLRGRIFPIAVLIGWGLAIYLCGRALRYYRDHDQTMGSSDFSRDGYKSDGWRGMLRYIKDWFAFRRWRRKASFGVDHLRFVRLVSKDDILSVMAARLRGLALQLLLTNQPLDPPSPELDLLLNRAAPLD